MLKPSARGVGRALGCRLRTAHELHAHLRVGTVVSRNAPIAGVPDLDDVADEIYTWDLFGRG